MLKLLLISEFSQRVAEAVSAVLEVDTEILADDLAIVGGTGKYQALIGTKGWASAVPLSTGS